MPELSSKDLHWFALANANGNAAFYAFKARFLRRFGTRAGLDRQRIELDCYGCEGSGFFTKSEVCRKCGGQGVYDVKEILLERWDLQGRIYHRPLDAAEAWPLRNEEPVAIIEGKIKHPPVDPSASRRAFHRLLLRHEPVTYYWVITNQWREGWLCFRACWAWKLIRLRNKLDLFPAVDEDLPF